MANEEHVERLLAGVDAWNAWRLGNPDAIADLRGADLAGANLRKALLSGADLTSADLKGADLTGAKLGPMVSHGSSEGVVFGREAFSTGLNNMIGPEAFLRRFDVRIAGPTNLKSADLCDAILNDALFTGVDLSGSSLDFAEVAGVVVGYGSVSTDWLRVRGIGGLHHVGPSRGAFDASRLSQGELPEAFLRGCGLLDWEIWAAKMHAPELTTSDIGTILEHVAHLKESAPIQVRPVFISYSRKDSAFVDRLASALRFKGVRFWKDTDHLVAGPLGTQIDRAIALNQTVLLVLSKHSIASDWVYSEVKKARKLEQQGAVDYALCPITLDEAWKETGWPDHVHDWLVDTYNILSFAEPDDFDMQFERLLEGLGVYYAKGAQ